MVFPNLDYISEAKIEEFAGIELDRYQNKGREQCLVLLKIIYVAICLEA